MKESERRVNFYTISLNLIKEKGFKAMTMRDLALAMNCDVSNVYNYTKSKDALLETLLFEISESFHQGMSEIEASNYSAVEKIKAVIALHVRLTVEHPNQVLLLVNEWRYLKSEPQKRFIDFRINYEEKLKSILQEGKENGSFQIDDVEFTTNCILSAIRWLYSWNEPEKNSFEVERLMTNFIFKGIITN